MDRKTLLISGFEPFGTESRNPSWEAVDALPDQIGDLTLEKRLLPVEYGRAADLLTAAANELRPAAILCVGLAAGRDAVTPEAIGVNVRDASIPDNAGRSAEGEPIDPDGPAAIAKGFRAAGVPAKLSYTAGTYVCNDLLYTLLRRFSGSDVRVAFVHIPLERTLSLSESIRALIAAIGAI